MKIGNISKLDNEVPYFGAKIDISRDKTSQNLDKNPISLNIVMKKKSPLLVEMREKLFISPTLFAKKHKVSENTVYQVLNGYRSTDFIIELFLKEGISRETIEKIFRQKLDGTWVLQFNDKKYRKHRKSAV